MEPGQLISHYELIEKIGEGGMGHVYKARDTKLNRHVAIKLLPPDLTSDEERRLRFRREAQAAAALDHPHIAVIHEVGEHEGNLFIVMQYLEGQSLGKLIGQRPLPLKEWLRLAIPIAEGLTHAHKHGIVHRDLKPDNVMLTNEGQVKLLDFGLAKLLEPEAQPGGGPDRDEELNSRLATISRELTRAGNVMGTIAYMSPEQARGESVDHRSDLFSFGVILYEMASGERPFKGKSEIESLHSTIAQDSQPLSQRTGGIPTEVERVVRKAMEKEPERRYPRCRGFGDRSQKPEAGSRHRADCDTFGNHQPSRTLAHPLGDRCRDRRGDVPRRGRRLLLFPKWRTDWRIRLLSLRKRCYCRRRVRKPQ